MAIKKELKMNSKEYWDYRFDNNWIDRDGIKQTEAFMKLIVSNLPETIKNYLSNKHTVLDWGCAIGIGVDVLATEFPKCTVSGMDLSESAINKSKELYSSYDFISGDINVISKNYDVIITSNVLEHFSDPLSMIEKLADKSKKYIVILVPYKEISVGGDWIEHQYSFNAESFPDTIGQLKLVSKDVIHECPDCWMAEQILVVYEKSKDVLVDKVIDVIEDVDTIEEIIEVE